MVELTNQIYAKDEIYTPQWIFEAMGVEFDLDVASADHPLIKVPANNKYTKEQNALIQPWFGFVFMNPPFSKVTPWIDKWLEHKNGVCLVPLSSNGRWVNKLWESEAVCVYLPANVIFNGADGRDVKLRWRTSLWGIGVKGIDALKRSEIGKVR